MAAIQKSPYILGAGQHRLYRLLRLILLLTIARNNLAASFRPASYLNIRRPITSSSLKPSFLALGESVASISDAESVLRFVASTTYTTKPMPAPARKKKRITDFFASEKYRDYLLVGTGNMQVEPMKSTTPLLNRWYKESMRVGTKKPVRDDKFLKLTLETGFLVFTVFAVATLGTKLLVPSSEKETISLTSLEHQFTLVKEDFWADGPSPLVWIFNQLTGVDRKDQASNKPQNNHAMYRVWAEPVNDGKDIVFTSHVMAEINIKFPSFLLQILPVRKEIIEEQGSKSLQKSMERDVPPGINKFRDAYIRWLRT